MTAPYVPAWEDGDARRAAVQCERDSAENREGDIVIDSATVLHYADRIMAMIAEDMKQPLPWGKQVPPEVTSFSELHDYCDANGYLAQAGVPWGTDPGAGEDGAEMVNTVCAEVTRRLEAHRTAAQHEDETRS